MYKTGLCLKIIKNLKNKNVLESFENSFYMVYTIKNHYYKPFFIYILVYVWYICWAVLPFGPF